MFDPTITKRVGQNIFTSLTSMHQLLTKIYRHWQVDLTTVRQRILWVGTSGVASNGAPGRMPPLEFQLVISRDYARQIRIDYRYYINSCGFLYPVSSILAISSAVQPSCYTVLIGEESVGG